MASHYILDEQQYKALIAGIRQRISDLESLQLALQELERRGPAAPETLSYDLFVEFVAITHRPLAEQLRLAFVVRFEAGRIKLRANGQVTSYLSFHRGVLKDLLERFAGCEFKRITIDKE